MPAGHLGRYAKLPGGGGDIITGNSFEVSAPSDGYSVIDIDASILPLPLTSPLWEVFHTQRSVTYLAIPTITHPHRTHPHRQQAEGVIRSLLLVGNGIPTKVQTLLEGKTSDYTSASEADYNLALFASYWSRDAAVIAAVLGRSRLVRKKWDRPDYLSRTIHHAVARRAYLASRPLPLPCDLSDTLPPGANDLPVMEILILFLKGQETGREFTRIPVGDMARYCDRCTKTFQRAVNRAAKAGPIETDVTCEQRGGGPKRT
jgi:hypothetical protein